MQAIVWAVDHFSVYIKDTVFDIVTDHKPVEKLSKLHIKTFHRLHQLMNEFQCNIRYRPGPDNVVADALSRNSIAAAADSTEQDSDTPTPLGPGTDFWAVLQRLN